MTTHFIATVRSEIFTISFEWLMESIEHIWLLTEFNTVVVEQNYSKMHIPQNTYGRDK